MIQSAWLFCGLVAILATAGALLTDDDGMAILLGVAGFGGWGMVAYGSFDLTVVGDSTTFSFTLPAMAIFAAGLSLIPMYIALTGPVDIVRRAKSPTTDEI